LVLARADPTVITPDLNGRGNTATLGKAIAEALGG
jgi:hypothetical protein